MIASAAMPAYIAVLCIFPFHLMTLQHVRTDLTCACSLPIAIAKRKCSSWKQDPPQSSITDFRHFSMLTRRRVALMQVVENAV